MKLNLCKSFIFILAISCSQVNAVEHNQKPSDFLAGEWMWAHKPCEKTMSISFNKDNTEMYHDRDTGLYLGDKSKKLIRIVYIIHEERNDRLITSIKGEDRRGKDGKLVSWDLVVKSKDIFCWRRHDWKPTSCTKKLRRCSE